jgi:Cd2+/Zn2+-exporting ATPase
LIVEKVDELEGVGSVEIDAATSTLRASIDPTIVASPDLELAVEKAGFEAVESVGHASWRIEGLDCPDCARTVAVSVERIPGVIAADLNFASALLSLEYVPDEDPRSLVEDALSKMGYRGVLSSDVAHRPVAEFRLGGLDCPDCARQLAASVGGLDGVANARVDFATARMRVGYDPATTDIEALRQAVKVAGYDVELAEEQAAPGANGWFDYKHEVATAVSGAAIAAGILADVLAAPEILGSMLYAIAIVAGGLLIARRAWASARMRVLDMNVLMTIAVLGAAAIGEWREGAVVVFLFSVGGLLESRSLARTRRSIRDLMDLAPNMGRVLQGEGVLEMPAADIAVGDVLVVRAGERIALDGVITSGTSAVDESPITGESVPIDKSEGDEVFAGSLNTSGVLEVRVTARSADTTLSRIIYLVEEAQSERAPSQQLVDRFTAYYTPIVVVLAVLVAVAPPAVGVLTGSDTGSFSEWFYRALVLLVVSCPCALVISTPVAIVSAITRATRDGILVKGGSHLEAAPTVRAVAFDKTGTLTRGQPEVVEVVAVEGGHADEVLAYAGALERDSTHPLAQAVMREAEASRPVVDGGVLRATDVREHAGAGVTGRIGGESWWVGGPRMAWEQGIVTAALEDVMERMERRGLTALVVWKERDREGNGGAVGVLGIADSVRSHAAEAVSALARSSVSATVMLTGDNERTAAAVAHEAGVSEYKARLLPEQKVEAVRELKSEYGVVAMVGDGINDAPALALSDLGIAMGAAGSDTAIETADVALMSDDLTAIPRFFDLGRRTVANIRQNVAVSVTIKLAVLLAAVAGYAPLWLAVFADTGVALLVILNGLRLLRPAPRSL